MPPRTAKQKRATKALIALNRRRSGGGTRRRSAAPRRRAPLRRSRAGIGGFGRRRAAPRSQFAKTVRRGGEVATGLVATYGATNPLVTVTTGRNLLHPGGDLNLLPRSNGKTIPLKNPFDGTATPSNKVMHDAWGIMTGSVPNFAGAPPTFGGRFRGATSVVGYNIRSSFTPGGGIATTWGPPLIASIVAPLIVPVIDGVAATADSVMSLVPGRA